MKHDGVRSRLIELEPSLLSMSDIDPTHRVLMFLPTSSDGTVQDAVLSDRLYQDLCILCSIGSTVVNNTVCILLKFWPPGINPEFMMECKLIAHPM